MLIYLWTLDNTVFFYIGCSDWYHQVPCPQNDTSVVPWDSLSPDDKIFLRGKYLDAGQGAVCDLRVGCGGPSSFFSRPS